MITPSIPLRLFAFLFAITLLGFAFRAWELGSQPLTDDETLVAVSAANYMETGHLGPVMWNHPPLRNIAVYYVHRAMNGGAWGLRGASVLLGTATIFLTGLVAFLLFRKENIACLSAFFIALDPVHIDFSRQAIQEVYMAAFTLFGIFLALRYRKNPMALLASGIAFGLGVASKWYVVFPMFVTAGYLLYQTVSDWRRGQGGILAEGALIMVSFSCIPAAVYAGSYAPWFLRGYGLGDWIELHRAMLNETLHHQGYNTYVLELDTKALFWFLKPVSYVDIVRRPVAPIVILGMSNVLVWMLTLPAFAYTAYFAFREKLGDRLYTLALFACAYLPFVLTSRPIWVHSALGVIPFAFMMNANLLTGISQNRKMLMRTYLALVVLVFIPLYLLAIGKGYDSSWLKPIVLLYRPMFER